MKNDLAILQKINLFKNIEPDELQSLLRCLHAGQKTYRADEFILLAGDAVSSVGIVLSGGVQITKEDYDGNRMILTELSAGDLFAETFACAGIKKSPVSVLAVTECEILWIEFSHVLHTCATPCAFHSRLIFNMLQLTAQKNVMLNDRISLLSRRSIREKLLTYFTLQKQKSGSNSFRIPFSRNELADFLCADRSALSRELCKMRDEGILSFHKNHFVLL